MLYPPVPELLTHIDSRYLLVNAIAKRAREISAHAEENHISLEDKPVTLAIREIAEGKYVATMRDEYKR